MRIAIYAGTFDPITYGHLSVVDFARQQGANYILRGVRTSTDVDAEITLANLNHQLAPEIETLFVPAHPELSLVSSSRLTQLAQRGDDISRHCPPGVAQRLTSKLAARPLQTDEVPHV